MGSFDSDLDQSSQYGDSSSGSSSDSPPATDRRAALSPPPSSRPDSTSTDKLSADGRSPSSASSDSVLLSDTPSFEPPASTINPGKQIGSPASYTAATLTSLPDSSEAQDFEGPRGAAGAGMLPLSAAAAAPAGAIPRVSGSTTSARQSGMLLESSTQDDDYDDDAAARLAQQLVSLGDASLVNLAAGMMTPGLQADLEEVMQELMGSHGDGAATATGGAASMAASVWLARLNARRAYMSMPAAAGAGAGVFSAVAPRAGAGAGTGAGAGAGVATVAGAGRSLAGGGGGPGLGGGGTFTTTLRGFRAMLAQVPQQAAASVAQHAATLSAGGASSAAQAAQDTRLNARGRGSEVPLGAGASTIQGKSGVPSSRASEVSAGSQSPVTHVGVENKSELRPVSDSADAGFGGAAALADDRRDGGDHAASIITTRSKAASPRLQVEAVDGVATSSENANLSSLSGMFAVPVPSASSESSRAQLLVGPGQPITSGSSDSSSGSHHDRACTTGQPGDSDSEVKASGSSDGLPSEPHGRASQMLGTSSVATAEPAFATPEQAAHTEQHAGTAGSHAGGTGVVPQVAGTAADAAAAAARAALTASRNEAAARARAGAALQLPAWVRWEPILVPASHLLRAELPLSAAERAAWSTWRASTAADGSLVVNSSGTGKHHASGGSAGGGGESQPALSFAGEPRVPVMVIPPECRYLVRATLWLLRKHAEALESLIPLAAAAVASATATSSGAAASATGSRRLGGGQPVLAAAAAGGIDALSVAGPLASDHHDNHTSKETRAHKHLDLASDVRLGSVLLLVPCVASLMRGSRSVDDILEDLPRLMRQMDSSPGSSHMEQAQAQASAHQDAQDAETATAKHDGAIMATGAAAFVGASGYASPRRSHSTSALRVRVQALGTVDRHGDHDAEPRDSKRKAADAAAPVPQAITDHDGIMMIACGGWPCITHEELARLLTRDLTCACDVLKPQPEPELSTRMLQGALGPLQAASAGPRYADAEQTQQAASGGAAARASDESEYRPSGPPGSSGSSGSPGSSGPESSAAVQPPRRLIWPAASESATRAQPQTQSSSVHEALDAVLSTPLLRRKLRAWVTAALQLADDSVFRGQLYPRVRAFRRLAAIQLLLGPHESAAAAGYELGSQPSAANVTVPGPGPLAAQVDAGTAIPQCQHQAEEWRLDWRAVSADGMLYRHTSATASKSGLRTGSLATPAVSDSDAASGAAKAFQAAAGSIDAPVHTAIPRAVPFPPVLAAQAFKMEGSLAITATPLPARGSDSEAAVPADALHHDERDGPRRATGGSGRLTLLLPPSAAAAAAAAAQLGRSTTDTALYLLDTRSSGPGGRLAEPDAAPVLWRFMYGGRAHGLLPSADAWAIRPGRGSRQRCAAMEADIIAASAATAGSADALVAHTPAWVLEAAGVASPAAPSQAAPTPQRQSLTRSLSARQTKSTAEMPAAAPSELLAVKPHAPAGCAPPVAGLRFPDVLPSSAGNLKPRQILSPPAPQLLPESRKPAAGAAVDPQDPALLAPTDGTGATDATGGIDREGQMAHDSDCNSTTPRRLVAPPLSAASTLPLSRSGGDPQVRAASVSGGVDQLVSRLKPVLAGSATSQSQIAGGPGHQAVPQPAEPSTATLRHRQGNPIRSALRRAQAGSGNSTRSGVLDSASALAAAHRDPTGDRIAVDHHDDASGPGHLVVAVPITGAKRKHMRFSLEAASGSPAQLGIGHHGGRHGDGIARGRADLETSSAADERHQNEIDTQARAGDARPGPGKPEVKKFSASPATQPKRPRLGTSSSRRAGDEMDSDAAGLSETDRDTSSCYLSRNAPLANPPLGDAAAAGDSSDTDRCTSAPARGPNAPEAASRYASASSASSTRPTRAAGGCGSFQRLTEDEAVAVFSWLLARRTGNGASSHGPARGALAEGASNTTRPRTP